MTSNDLLVGVVFLTVILMIFSINRLSNINQIVKDYVEFLISLKGKTKILSIFFYMILPVIYGLLISFNILVDENVINIIGLVFSILLGVLFTFLSMLISVNERYCSSYRTSTRKLIIQEVFVIIMYEIVIAIIILIMTMMYMFIKVDSLFLEYVRILANIFYFSFAIAFMFNFTIILKRIYNLYKDIFIKTDISDKLK